MSGNTGSNLMPYLLISILPLLTWGGGDGHGIRVHQVGCIPIILESLLGVRISGDLMRFDPCIPVNWSSYKIEYRYRSTKYTIIVQNSKPGAVVRTVVVDGIFQADETIHLTDDLADHQVIVEL